jgi:hypothetical protein
MEVGTGRDQGGLRSAKCYLRVRNWEKFQHYKDRNPPWIKLHGALLEDEGFAALPDATKLHLIGIWLLASRLNNRIPASPGFIANRINATDSVDLKALMDAGFLEACQPEEAACEQPASALLATCPPETEESRDRGEREPPPKAPPSPDPDKRQRRQESRAVADRLSDYRNRLARGRLRTAMASERAEWRRAWESGRFDERQLQGLVSEHVWSALVAAGQLARDAPWPPPGLAPYDARGSPGGSGDEHPRGGAADEASTGGSG